uniref:Uncharacterized protein n=1 Tax=Acrobeloides nanus TaxID=290746 RepID=A0A914EQ41_9BILA
MNRLNPTLLYEITSNYLCGKYFSSIPKIVLMNRDFYHAFIAHFRYIRVLYLVEDEERLTKRFPANESGDFVIINTIDFIREQNLAQLDTLAELYPSYNLHTTFAVFNFLLKLRCIQTIDYLSLARHYPLCYKDNYVRGKEDTNLHHLIQRLHDAELKISYFFVHCDDHPDVWKSFNCLLHQQEPVAIEFVRSQRVLQCISPEVQIDYLDIFIFCYEKMPKPLKTKVLRLRHYSIAKLMKVLKMVQTDCLQIETCDNTKDLMKLTV